MPGAYTLEFGNREDGFGMTLNFLPDGMGYQLEREPWDDSAPVRFSYFDWQINNGVLDLLYRQGGADNSFDWDNTAGCIENCEQLSFELIAIQDNRQFVRVTEPVGDVEGAFSEIFMIDLAAAPDMASNKIAVQFYDLNTGSSVSAQAFSSNADGTGVYTNWSGRSDYTESLVGQIKLLKGFDMGSVSYPNMDCDGNGAIQVREEWALTSILILNSNGEKPDYVPAAVKSWSIVKFWEATYPENPACESITNVQLAADLFAYSESDFMPIPVSAGTYALDHSWINFSDGSTTSSIMVELNADGTGTAIESKPVAAPLEWNANNGALESISIDNGLHQIYPFGSVMELPVGNLIVSIENVDGNLTASGGVIIKKDDSFVLTESNVVATYTAIDSSFDISYNQDGFGGLGDANGNLYWWHHWMIDVDALRSFRYMQYVDSDGDGVPDDTDANGIPDDVIGNSWNSEESARYCATAVEGACGLWMNRSYLPIAEDGDIVYLFRNKLLYQNDVVDSWGLSEPQINTHTFGSIWQLNKATGLMSKMSNKPVMDTPNQPEIFPFELKTKLDRLLVIHPD